MLLVNVPTLNGTNSLFDKLGDLAFGILESLQLINLPDTVTEMGHGMFGYCHS
jgi:hypothetical protein